MTDLIVGGGAVGSLVGWALAAGGRDVAIVRRGLASAPRTADLTVVEPDREERTATVTEVARPEDLVGPARRHRRRGQAVRRRGGGAVVRGMAGRRDPDRLERRRGGGDRPPHPARGRSDRGLRDGVRGSRRRTDRRATERGRHRRRAGGGRHPPVGRVARVGLPRRGPPLRGPRRRPLDEVVEADREPRRQRDQRDRAADAGRGLRRPAWLRGRAATAPRGVRGHPPERAAGRGAAGRRRPAARPRDTPARVRSPGRSCRGSSAAREAARRRRCC